MTHRVDDALEPCPFCGGEAVLGALPEAWESETPRFNVECDNCGAQAPSRGRTKDEARASWNTRVESAGVAELREALSYSADDWAALSRIIETNIKETDGPDRVRWDGVWHEGPLATAYLETLRAIKEMADRNIAALANQGKA